MIRRPPRSTRTDTLCPYTTLFRSSSGEVLPRVCRSLKDDLTVFVGSEVRLLGCRRHVETATRGIEKTAHRHQSVLCSGRNEIDWGLAAKDARVVGSAKPCNAIALVLAENSEDRKSVLSGKRVVSKCKTRWSP